MTEKVEFGSKTIEFQLQFVDRKTLGITVTPDMEVLVKAPLDAPLQKVKEKVHKRAPWILKQQNFFQVYHPRTPKRRFISGESHLYLGRQYRLKVTNDVKAENSVKLKRGILEVIASNERNVEKLVEDWYLNRAKLIIKPLAEFLFNDFIRRHKIKDLPFQFSFRKMSTRWGSCSSQGRITLNPELIKAPKGSIEYVIIHELCHLVHHNHSPAFLELQEKEMPDWEKWKNKLEILLN